MVFRKCIHSIKPLFPLIIGLMVGLALSGLVRPWLNTKSCLPAKSPVGEESMNEENDDTIIGNDNEDSDKNGKNFDYGESDDFEPRIKTQEKSEVKNSESKKLLRPRYASTELGIREKLFVGVVTSRETIETFGAAVNKTLAQYVPKIVFFMNSRGPELPSGLSVVIFSNEDGSLVPYHMFKYIQDHYMESYDWYYLVSDETYTRGEKLFDLVTHMSVTRDVYMGVPIPDQNGAYCSLDGGILISQSVLGLVIRKLETCIQRAVTHSKLSGVGQCIRDASTKVCTDSANQKKYISHYRDRFEVVGSMPSMQGINHFQDALTVYTVKDDVNMYKLHRYFCEHELNKTRMELEDLKGAMVETAKKGPGGVDALPWPIGVDPPASPKTRFDVIRWEYFTETHIYLQDDFTNMRELKGVDKLDVQDVLKVSMEKLNVKYNNRFTYSRLINGYRRFDPVRGMEYTIDLMLKDRISRTEIQKRVHLLRPLSFVEIVPMPYVTESSRVNLVLPVKVSEKDDVVSFLDSYAHVCLESGDNTHLFIVFIYDENNPQNSQDDAFSVLKSMISFYETKYQNGAKIAWTGTQHSNPTQFTILDTISRKFPKETLFLLCTVGMELSIEFLNRVRMNTISKWQVFFPIAFYQYKPNLIYEEKPYPTEIEIHSKTGRFDEKSYKHASFYNTDYQYARKQMISTSASQNIDLFDMFLKYHSIHVFRAVEPALKHKYRERQCEPSMEEETYHRCLESRAEGLASRSQLAMLVFEHQKKLDHKQMDVIHQKQQKGANVDQMKPNMLR